MKVIARSLVMIFVALIAVPALAVSYTMATAVQLLATTALIMGGTQHPLSLPTDSNAFVTAYMAQAENNFIDPNNTQNMNRVAVIYPAEFFPVFGSTTFDDSVAIGRDNLHACLQGSVGCSFNTGVGSTPPSPTDDFIVFGYSQSAVVASLVKNDLINGAPGPDTATFVLAANPMRPNGGILARGFEGLTIPILGITFYGPTQNSCPGEAACADPAYPTVDVAQQYDFLGGDAPARPLNVLAMANSLAAYVLLHGSVPDHSITEPGIINQGTYGDTQYYMIPAYRLPILMLVGQLGVPDPILAVIDAPLREVIEAGYVRDQSPGEHVTFKLSPIGNPITLVVNVAKAIPIGIDDGLQEAGIGRVLGTPDVYRPFGVSGPAYDKTTGEEVTTTQTTNLNAQWGSSAPQGNSAPDLKLVPPPEPQAEQPQPTVTEQGGTDPKPEQLGTGQDEIGNDTTADEATPPPAVRPRPLRDLLRGPIKFEPPKLPSLRPDGDGPLKRIVNALTGQRPQSASDPEPSADSSTDSVKPAA